MSSEHAKETQATHPVLSPDEARSGVTSGRVRIILAVSTVLTAIGLAIVYTIFA